MSATTLLNAKSVLPAYHVPRFVVSGKAGSTVLNGMQVDKAVFKKDVERIVKTMRAAKK